jgi:hypothetical protein
MATIGKALLSANDNGPVKEENSGTQETEWVTAIEAQEPHDCPPEHPFENNWHAGT